MSADDWGDILLPFTVGRLGVSSLELNLLANSLFKVIVKINGNMKVKQQ